MALLIAQDVHPKTSEHRLGQVSINVTLDHNEQLFAALGDALTDRLDAIYRAADQDGEQ